jgi:hypothetical protein
VTGDKVGQRDYELYQTVKFSTFYVEILRCINREEVHFIVSSHTQCLWPFPCTSFVVN